ncbi:Developmental and secondary metabolism regulator veA [Paramyrothecium foliicola]|nr:Developmental and secondary metabolism regulator veA [Paramyrothecium foliicola]
MATPADIPTEVEQESVSRIRRVTRENRTLWYQLSVLQQPERARACGSGMKANSDRRPVDPPPVVELRIIEGASISEGKDITFDYNANFFLYASLEHARPLAHGRVQNAATNNPPILTGVPASGMAYLDRPTEAGYFIFPDLSVRHEGLYKLTFSLFETTKEEKDFDLEPADGDLPPGVDWRMEIQTQPFIVFSAKKFPGLMESTQLSKTVADQGCRVRIRRDVRMRKRDATKSNGYERREEDYPSRHRTVTPAAEDPHSIRARSASNSSEHRAPYASESQRRPSAVGANASYPPPPPPPSYEPSRNSGGHLAFGDPTAPQYATPRQFAQPPQPPVPQSPTGPYQAVQPSPYVKAEATPYGYHSTRNLSHSSTGSIQPIKIEPYERRQSATHLPPSPSVYSSAEGHFRRDSTHSYPATPIMPHPVPRAHMPNLPVAESRSQHSLAPLKISSLISPLPPIEAQTEPLPPVPVIPTGSKRKHESVFDQIIRPLHNGERPRELSYSRGRYVTEDELKGTYARADGRIECVTFNEMFESD